MDWRGDEAEEDAARREIVAWEEADKKKAAREIAAREEADKNKAAREAAYDIAAREDAKEERKIAAREEAERSLKGVVVSLQNCRYAPSIDGSFAGTVVCSNNTNDDIVDLHIHIDFMVEGAEVAEWAQDATRLAAGQSRSWPVTHSRISRYLVEPPFFEWDVLCKSSGVPLCTIKGDFQCERIFPKKNPPKPKPNHWVFVFWYFLFGFFVFWLLI